VDNTKRDFRWLGGILVISLLLVTVASTIGSVKAADSGDVQPDWVYQITMNFNPAYAGRYVYTTATGYMYMYSPVIADVKFEMIIDGRLAKPQWITGNVPYKDFVYESYNSHMGGPAWHYDSGVLWYIGYTTAYLQVRTYASAYGTYKGFTGTDYTIPPGWAMAYFYCP